MGCASGKGAGPRNIFGNKYGQSLAAVQIARERRLEAKEQALRAQQEENERNKSDEDETDDEGDGGPQQNAVQHADDDAETDDDDFGPAPQAGIWASSQKLQDEALEYYDDDAETDDEEGPQPEPPVKKAKIAD